MKKYRAFVNFYKEEAFINKIATKGYRLVDCSWYYYHFELSDKRYLYRLDYFPVQSEEKKKYLTFLEELNLNYLNSKSSSWIYVEKEDDTCDFELYTNYQSRLERAKRVGSSIKVVLFTNSFLLVLNLLNLKRIGFSNPFSAIMIVLIVISAITILVLTRSLYDLSNHVNEDSE